MRPDHPDPTADRQPAPSPSSAPSGRRPTADGPADAASPHPADDAVRTPDEYTETPGSHRRPDGAATDVGG